MFIDPSEVADLSDGDSMWGGEVAGGAMGVSGMSNAASSSSATAGVGHDLWEMGSGALEVMKHSPIGSLLSVGYHGVAGTYDAITGDRHGAVDHGAEALTSAAGMLHPLAGVGMGAFGLLHKMVAHDSDAPGVGEAVGEGANGIFDKLFGKSEEKEHKTSPGQGIVGTLGALAGAPLGPLGMMAGGAAGRWLGGLL